MSLLASAFGPGAIVFADRANDWRHALEIAGAALAASGCTTDGYSQHMISVVEELGPYIVIAPGLALGHARPNETVIKTGMSVAVFTEPVVFGNAANDPVHAVFALAARDHDAHLELLAEFANLASGEGFVNSLLTCSDVRTFRALL